MLLCMNKVAADVCVYRMTWPWPPGLSLSLSCVQSYPFPDPSLNPRKVSDFAPQKGKRDPGGAAVIYRMSCNSPNKACNVHWRTR